MGSSLRALRALLLLAGFYLVGFALLGSLVAVAWAATVWTTAAVFLKLYVVTALVAFPVLRSMFQLRRASRTGVDRAGLRVTPAQEPELWSLVRELASSTGTRAPDELYLDGEVNASVQEDSRFLGLRTGTRRMYLGVPLMSGLTEPQLRAVLAHEFGHFGNRDTRYATITLRGRESVVRTVSALHERSLAKVAKETAKQREKQAKALARGRKPKSHDLNLGSAGLTYRLAARPFLAYGGFYLRSSLGVGRAQELAADLTAVRVAGRDATASALREIPVLDSAHDFYLSAYATVGAGAGLLPPRGEMFGGLHQLMAARAGEMAELRAAIPHQEQSPYDSHPPIAERVARIEALPADAWSAYAAEAAPATGLLRDLRRTLVDLEDAVLAPETLAMRRAASWPDLLSEGMAAHYADEARPLREATAELTSTRGDFTDVLDAIDKGMLWQLADRLPKSPEAAAAQGRVARELTRPVLRECLSRLAVLHLLHTGHAQWHLSWSQTPRPVFPEGYEAQLTSALNAAIADHPRTTPLRDLASSPSPVSPASSPSLSS
ncbi:M48 family metalloprotease [Streptomyces sp. NPDC051561]|uniref:M48 family metalloprotease n=1 Tax=Streptomyces sp. NPDC051561 TaxID=3365658 RepID=UPI003793D4AE